jgi:hypothetical protein
VVVGIKVIELIPTFARTGRWKWYLMHIGCALSSLIHHTYISRIMLTRYLFAFIVCRGASAFTSLGGVTARSPTTRVLSKGSTTNFMAAPADNSNDDEFRMLSRRSALSSFLAGATAVTLGMAGTASEARAAEGGSRTIGQISGSGLVFKDTLVIESFDDPKVRGVTLYVSNFERPLTGKLTIYNIG